MTSREALGLLASRVQVGAYKEEMQKCFNIVNEAINKLEKRDIPMKVINGTTINGVCLDYECPSCKQGIDNSRYSKDQYYLIKHCISCGQRLDWS